MDKRGIHEKVPQGIQYIYRDRLSGSIDRKVVIPLKNYQHISAGEMCW